MSGSKMFQGLPCAVERIPILVIEPVVLKQALDFEQRGEDGVALIIAATIDDSLRVQPRFPWHPASASE
jgi:hypothetical protein